MAISIDELRMSFVWLEYTPALMVPGAEDSAMAALGRRAGYWQKFEDARDKPGTLKVPWPPSRGRYIHRFWSYYLEFGRLPLVDVGADDAWNHLVPLRESIKSKVTIQPPESAPVPRMKRVTVEGYSYPHAMAVVVTLEIETNAHLEVAVDRAVALRNAARYQLEPPQEPYVLDALGAHLMKRQRDKTLELNTQRGRTIGNPLSIVTVIKGSEAGQTRPKSKGQIHRALEGLCTWNTNWRMANPHKLAECRLDPIDNDTPFRLLYGTDKGRAVWFPDAFEVRGVTHLLGCYHKNLTMLSLQVESLIAMSLIAESYLSSGRLMPPSMEDLARRSVIILERFYKGESTTYKSKSAARQIVDSGQLGAINNVRKTFGLTPIA